MVSRWRMVGVWGVSGGCLGASGGVWGVLDVPSSGGKFVIFSQIFSIISKISYHTSPKHILFL